MERIKLPTDKISPLADDVVAGFHRSIVEEVQSTVARDRVVVVGMKQNPVVKRAREFLAKEGVQFTYLEYGSYVSKWKERLAIKLWAGFPTFPMVFVGGTLVGGNSELVKFHADGKLKS
jgi:glutaredoxin-related protein